MEFLLLKYAHIIATVYWLGGDLGTYFASNQVINRDLSPEARRTALKIMLACDMGPKLAMPLIFALGVHLADLLDAIALPGWGVGAAWALSLWWFGNVLFLHLNEGKPAARKVAQFDLVFRIAVVALVVLYSTAQLLDAAAATADWVAWKLLVFAALVACGIFIRLHLRPFVPAFTRMMNEGGSAETDAVMHASLMRCRPFVWAIWAGLFVNTALGVRLIG